MYVRYAQKIAKLFFSTQFPFIKKYINLLGPKTLRSDRQKKKRETKTQRNFRHQNFLKKLGTGQNINIMKLGSILYYCEALTFISNHD